MDPITAFGKHHWFQEVMASGDAQRGIYFLPNWPTKQGSWGSSLWLVTNATVPGKEWWPSARKFLAATWLSLASATSYFSPGHLLLNQ